MFADAPLITAQGVENIGTTTADGTGTISNFFNPNIDNHGVCWNELGSPTLADTCTDEGRSASPIFTFSSAISNLLPGTTYYLRAYATNADGIAYGADPDVEFTTDTIPPTVTTQAVSSIGQTTATGNGTITILGAPNPTQHGVCWNTTGTPTTADNKTEQGPRSVTTPFTSSITSLSPNTTYYVRAYATNGPVPTYGDEVEFTSSAQPPTVSTQAVSSIGQTTATGNGTITNLGVPNPTQHGVCWNTTGSPTTSDSKTEQGPRSVTTPFTSSITGLSPNTRYYVRAYATNGPVPTYGNEVEFTTLIQAPTVTTQAVSSIGQTTATGNGTITNLGAPNPTQHGVCWNTTGSPTTSDNKTEQGPRSVTTPFTSSMTGLSPNTRYYVRAYATNGPVPTYGNEVEFTSSAQPPTVSTQAVSSIGQTTATGNGTITNLGVPNPTQHGVCWNTTGSPTTSDSKTEQGPRSVTTPFTSSMTGLSPNTRYYVRAYATNGPVPTYGNEVQFTTLMQPPTVTTQAVSSIGQTTATGNGNLTILGAPAPTAHGVCWNTTQNPTLGRLSGSFTDEGAASAAGPFYKPALQGLLPDTTILCAGLCNKCCSDRRTAARCPLRRCLNAPAVTTQAVTDVTKDDAIGHGTITALGVPSADTARSYAGAGLSPNPTHR